MKRMFLTEKLGKTFIKLPSCHLFPMDFIATLCNGIEIVPGYVLTNLAIVETGMICTRQWLNYN